MASALEDVTVRAVRHRLTISTFSSLSSRWLMLRLQAFSARFPDIELQVITTGRLVDFAIEDVDIAIRFGGGRYPELHVMPMFQPREIVVYSPSLLQAGPPIHSFDDLKHHTLLHDDSYREWTRWLDAVGAKGVSTRRGIICVDRNAMIQAAVGGQGIALASGVFAQVELEAGRLVKVFPNEVVMDYAIYTVCLPKRLTDPIISGTLEWLALQAQASNDGHVPAQ